MFRETKKQIEIAAESQKNKAKKDDRFLELKPDANGNASLLIRFLPCSSKDNERLVPTFFVEYFFHAINRDKAFLYENCPTTIAEKCPICDYNYKNWKNYNTKEEKSRSRKKKYIANVLIVKDNQNPSNNGKVMLYRFGKTIYNKIMEQIRPTKDEYEAKEPYDIVDVMTGKNFLIRTKTTKTEFGDYPNYDDSKFTDPCSIYDGDKDKINQVAENIHLLEEFVFTKDKGLRPYNEIKDRFDNFISGMDGDSRVSSEFNTRNSGAAAVIPTSSGEKLFLNDEPTSESKSVKVSKELPPDNFFDE